MSPGAKLAEMRQHPAVAEGASKHQSAPDRVWMRPSKPASARPGALAAAAPPPMAGPGRSTPGAILAELREEAMRYSTSEGSPSSLGSPCFPAATAASAGWLADLVPPVLPRVPAWAAHIQVEVECIAVASKSPRQATDEVPREANGQLLDTHAAPTTPTN